MKLQKRLKIVQILLAGVLIIIIAGTGWYVRQQNREPSISSFDDCLAFGNPVTTSEPRQCTFGKIAFFEKSIEKQAVVTQEEGVGVVVFKDWGVELPLTDAAKLQISTVPKSNINPVLGSFDAYAQLKFVEGYIQNKDCLPTLSLYRSDLAFKQGSQQKLISGFYYAVSGLPNPRCPDTPPNPDRVILDRFLSEFTVANLRATN